MHAAVSLFSRARPLTGVALTGSLVSLLILLAGDLPLPALSAQLFAAATAFRAGPALTAVVVLALLASGMHEWENLASRSLLWRRLVVGLGAIALGVGLLLPAALVVSTTPQPVLVVVQGVLACCGVGMLVSPWLAYSGQAAVAFTYGLVSLNAAWAARGPLGTLVTLGVQPTRERIVVAGLIALAGLVVQARRSCRMT